MIFFYTTFLFHSPCYKLDLVSYWYINFNITFHLIKVVLSVYDRMRMQKVATFHSSFKTLPWFPSMTFWSAELLWLPQQVPRRKATSSFWQHVSTFCQNESAALPFMIASKVLSSHQTSQTVCRKMYYRVFPCELIFAVLIKVQFWFLSLSCIIKSQLESDETQMNANVSSKKMQYYLSWEMNLGCSNFCIYDFSK